MEDSVREHNLVGPGARIASFLNLLGAAKGVLIRGVNSDVGLLLVTMKPENQQADEV